MLVGAIGLLAGDRADPSVVRPGADEATVQGRFVVRRRRDRPHPGRAPHRSFARLPRRPAGHRRGAGRAGRRASSTCTASTPTSGCSPPPASGGPSIASPASTSPTSRRLAPRVRAADAVLEGLGGDAAARERELDFLRFQLDEIEPRRAHRPRRGRAPRGRGVPARRRRCPSRRRGRRRRRAQHRAGSPRPGRDRAGRARRSELRSRPIVERLRGVEAELDDVARELRTTADAIEGDPERLAAVQARRAAAGRPAAALRRRRPLQPGRPVRGAGRAARPRSPSSTATPSGPRPPRRPAPRRSTPWRAAAAVVGQRRREPRAGALAGAVQARLARARAGQGPGRHRRWATTIPATTCRSSSRSTRACPPPPLAKAASGGELARTMLALRLIVGAQVPTLVFDEVDAGVGGARGPLGGPRAGGAGREQAGAGGHPPARRSRPSPTPRSRSRSTTTAPPR